MEEVQRLEQHVNPYHPGECGEWDTEELPLEKTKDEILSRNQDFF